MTEYTYTNVHYVPASEWPFDHDGAGLQQANILAPDGHEWMKSIDGESGYLLMRFEDADGDE